MIAETAELTGLPTDDPFRFGGGALFAGDPDGAGARGVSLTLRSEVIRIPFRDPFRIARTLEAGDGGGMTAVIVELDEHGPTRRRGARRGLPGRVLRRDARDGPGRPAAPPGCGGVARGPARRSGGGRGHGPDGPRSRRPTGWMRRSATTARPSAPSTSPSTTSSGGRSACRSTCSSACRAAIPPTDFTIGIDEPAIVGRAGRPGRPVPGPEDQAGRPGRPRDPRRGPGGLRGPDPGRREHRLEPRGRRSGSCPTSSASASSSSSSRSRPAGWTTSRRSRRSRRCRSWPTRAR